MSANAPVLDNPVFETLPIVEAERALLNSNVRKACQLYLRAANATKRGIVNQVL